MSDIDHINALVSKRGHVKQRLTKQKAWLNETQANSDEFSTRLEIVSDIYEQFIDINAQILELTDYNPEHEEYHDSFEATFIEVKSGLQSKIDEFKKPNTSSPELLRTSTSDSTRKMQIQLPFIKLPTFTGKYDEWVSFRDIFKSLINEERSLSDIQRFHYLVGNLSGDARKLVDNIDLSEQGYKQAWSALVNRYDNARLIIDKHVNSILNLNTMRSETSAELHKLIDNCVNHLTALQTLKQSVDHWDIIIVNIISARLIGETKTLWEMSIEINEIPTWEKMLKFLNNRARVLDAIESKPSQSITTPKSTATSLHKESNKPFVKNYSGGSSRVFATTTTPTNVYCSLCESKLHYALQCSQFIQLSVSERIKKVNQLNLCINCLRSGHSVDTCRSRMCNACRQRHHTLLHSHFENTQSYSANSNISSHRSNVSLPVESSGQTTLTAHLAEEITIGEVCVASEGAAQPEGYIWLSTAIVNIQDSCGRVHRCRALLDAAAQSNFLTQEMVDKLNLSPQPSKTKIKGISGITAVVQSAVSTTIASRLTSYSKHIQFMVVPNITCKLPHKSNSVKNWLIPSHIKLADPQFNIPQQIDALLGAECYYECLLMEQVRLHKGLPILQNTSFGFIIGGKMEGISNDSIALNVTIDSADTDLQEELKQLWQLEPVTNQGHFTPEEKECENIFVNTYSRDASTGRYTVELPFNENISKLGDSKQAAIKRFMYLEQRLERNEELRNQYIKFMAEYISLDHMESVSDDTALTNRTIFIYRTTP